MTTKNNYKNFEREFCYLYNIHEEILKIKKFKKRSHLYISLCDDYNSEPIKLGPEMTQRIEKVMDERLIELEKELNDKYGFTMKG